MNSSFFFFEEFTLSILFPDPLMWVKVTQLCPTICDPMACSPSGSSVHGLLQARILKWVAISFSRRSSPPRDWTWVSCLAAAAAAKSLQSCPTLWDPIDGAHQASPSLGFSRQEHWSGLPFPSPMHESESEVSQSCLTPSDPIDCSSQGPSFHGIFQARVMEWVAIAFSTPAL